MSDSNLLLALAVAFAVAMIADALVSRYVRRAAALAVLSTVVAGSARGTISWR